MLDVGKWSDELTSWKAGHWQPGVLEMESENHARICAAKTRLIWCNRRLNCYFLEECQSVAGFRFSTAWFAIFNYISHMALNMEHVELSPKA